MLSISRKHRIEVKKMAILKNPYLRSIQKTKQMKILKRIIIVIVLLVAIIIAAAMYYLQSQSPKYSGEIKLNGLEKQVEVVFDEIGVPHIYAKNEKDAYYALGYVQAQERLFQMALYRRLVQGRAAEILGPALIPTDKYFHTLGLYEVAKKAADKHFNSKKKEKFHEPALAYLEGINTFIAEDRLPIEFLMIGFKPELFTVEDIYAGLNLTALGFSFAQREDLILNYIYNDLGPDYFQDWSTDFVSQPDSTSAATALLMGEQLDKAMQSIGLPLWEGSNGWVLGPKKTKSGRALLANDTHIGFSQPAVWYEAHLNYPGYDFYGSFLPTCPFAVIGHNKNLGWGLTIFPFDNMDYYQVEDAENPENYLYFGETLPYQIEEIEIAVKDADAELFTRKSTKFGPIINQIEPFVDSVYEANIALSWAVFHLEQTAVEALYLLNQAQNMESFEKALPLIDIVGLNVMYADADDNIAWWGCGQIPVRDSLSQSFLFLHSNHSQDETFGFQSFDKNPFVINPTSGFIATANNNPVYSGGHFESGNYLPTDRVNRITSILEAKDNWDTEDCKEVQLDDVSTVKAGLAHFIVDHLIDLPKDGNYRKAAKILSDWDGAYGLQNTAPTIFSRLYYHIGQLSSADELGPILFDKSRGSYLLKKALPKMIYNEDSPWWNTVGSTEKTTRDQILTLAFMTTVDELNKELGAKTSDWKWMKVHTLTHEHPIGKKEPFDKVFNVGPFPVAGGNQVINKMEYSLSNDPIHRVGSGPAIRMLIDFADVDAAENIIPTGQSGNFRSPYYEDQAEMYVNGEYRKMLMNKSMILSSDHNILQLIPQ